MDNDTNMIAGWALFAGVIALGSSLLSDEMFKHGEVEKGGYEVVDAAPVEGGGAAKVEPTNFAGGDPAKGAEVFKKCASCHNVTPGGPNGIGPNLHGVMGRKHAGVAGFAYSSGLAAKPGNWTWEAMDAWLANPKKYSEGTKMSFAGLSKPTDRADVIVYLNAQGSNLPVPAAPAADAPAAATPTDAAAAPADAAAAPPAKS